MHDLLGPSVGHFTVNSIIERKNLEYFLLLKDNGITFFQIFIDFTEKDKKTNITKFKKFVKNNKLSFVVHSSYKHNLSKNWDENSWWIRNIIKEIKYASEIGALGIVIHTGKKMDLNITQAINNMYMALLYINSVTSKYKNAKIIIETPVGQGSEIFSDIRKLGDFYEKIKDKEKRFGICVDTCHIFAAGYDISTIKKASEFLTLLEDSIGHNNIYLLHLNDSYHPLNSKIDRHQTLGDGYIGMEGLKCIVKWFKKFNIPIILETPTNQWISEINKL